MKAVVSVLGKDHKGIIAKVSTALFEEGVNILDITQTIMQSQFFTMVMVVELPDDIGIGHIQDRMNELSKQVNVEITIRHEDIFNSMHKV